MCLCVVCGNSSRNTKYTRPELVYHKFPKNENLRKQWLKKLSIGQYSVWKRVCSDHFLPDNYKPGLIRKLSKNTVPQPYNQKCDQNGFPNNYPIQINDIETGNYAVLPMEPNIINNEEDIGNTVVNNFKAQIQPSRKIKSTRINDMNYYEERQIPTVIETDVKPVTKVRTSSYSPRCSVNNCFNTYSMGFSFFGYPSDLGLRNKWIAKTGLVVEFKNHYKVCSAHFEDDCFVNTDFKKRLRHGAIPTLFVDDGVIDGRNSTALPIPINTVRSASNARKTLPDEGSNDATSNYDFPTIDSNLKQKLQNISDKNSLSITLKPIENSKVIEPSVDLFSKTSAKCSISITLEPKLKHNRFSTTNNSSPYYDSLMHSLPSTSSFSGYNREAITQQSSLQYKQKATSTLKMQDKLSSNTVICPEFIDNQSTSLKCVSPENNTKSSEFLEIMSPHDSNSDYTIGTSECEIIDNGNTRVFKKKDHGFIFEISKTVILPSLFWKTLHLRSENATAFCYKTFNENTEKKIYFYNSLVPIVELYGKKYKYNEPIKSKNQLENLLEKIDAFEKCSGSFYEKCIGYFNGSSDDTQMCSACQEWETNHDFSIMNEKMESNSKTIEWLKKKIAERESNVIRLRNKLKKE